MCVILVAQKVRPTEEMVKKAWDVNDDGGGIAWREKRKVGDKFETIVRWKKGVMEFEEMAELCAKIPLPYVAHFRIASIGGVKPSLTHPFPISTDVSLALEGETKGGVLFHNGHWGMWDNKLLDAVINSNTKLPVGEWSDTRAIALLMHIYGPGLMDLLTTQKGVHFTAQKTDVFVGPGWKCINDVWCSNDSPQSTRVRHTTHHTGSGNNRGTYNYCERTGCTNLTQANKKICYACERKDTEKEIAGANPQKAGAEPTEKTQVAVTSLTVVNSKAVGTTEPKGQAVISPLAEALPLVEAELLYKEQGMSKTDIKKFRKLYSQVRRARSDKRKGKLTERLQEHTEKVTRLLVQAV